MILKKEILKKDKQASLSDILVNYADSPEFGKPYTFIQESYEQFLLTTIKNVNDGIEKAVDLQPLISYQPNPFTIFYIGSSIDFDEGPDGYKSFDMLQSNRQIFLKFQYLFQT